MTHSMLAAMFTEYRKYGKQNSMFEFQLSICDLVRLFSSRLFMRNTTLRKK